MRTADVVQILPSDKTHARALEILQRVPGVGAIASAERPPLDGILRDVTLETSADSLRRAKFNVVSPNYFDILGINVIRGRVFTADEVNGRQSVVLVSRAAAEQFWPNAAPIGRRLRWTRSAGGGAADSASAVPHDATVVGVMSDVSPGWIGLSQDWPMIYLPQPLDASRAVILARVSGVADAAIPGIERALTRDDSTTIQDIHSMTGSLELQRFPFHAAYWIASGLGLIALLLTITGVCGVVAYVVAQRTREFGVRLALGATPGGVVALVLRQLLKLAVAAVAVGALAALGTSRYMASQLTFVDAYSVRGYATGVLAVLLSCVLAAYVPSRRAGTVNPVDALRAD
jgi:ABC-type antimicrobial peptide transport system permease subunit